MADAGFGITMLLVLLAGACLMTGALGLWEWWTDNNEDQGDG